MEDTKKNVGQWPLMIGRDAWFHRIYFVPNVPREAYYKTKMTLAFDYQHNDDTVLSFCVCSLYKHIDSLPFHSERQSDF